jgi:hypothetical protein
MIRRAAFTLLLMIASCEDAGPGPVAATHSPSNGKAAAERAADDLVGPESMCVYIVANSADPLEVFDLTSMNGGRACYREGRRTVFLPAKNLACDYEPGFDLDLEEIISPDEMHDQFSACTALTGRGPIAPETEALIISHQKGSTSQGEREWYLCAADLRALVTNGALSVTNFQSGFGIVCLDTDQPDRLRAQIAASSSVSNEVIIETRKSDCKTEMLEANRRAVFED